MSASIPSSGSPSSTGEPLSNTDQLRAENAKLLRKLELAHTHRQHSIETRRELERKLIGWREAAEKAARERDAYKRAKQENDERFQLAAAEAREERDEARARVAEMEEHLSAAQHRHRAYPSADSPNAYCLNCLTGQKEVGSNFPEYVKWPCPDAVALGMAKEVNP